MMDHVPPHCEPNKPFLKLHLSQNVSGREDKGGGGVSGLISPFFLRAGPFLLSWATKLVCTLLFLRGFLQKLQAEPPASSPKCSACLLCLSRCSGSKRSCCAPPPPLTSTQVDSEEDVELQRLQKIRIYHRHHPGTRKLGPQSSRRKESQLWEVKASRADSSVCTRDGYN